MNRTEVRSVYRPTVQNSAHFLLFRFNDLTARRNSLRFTRSLELENLVRNLLSVHLNRRVLGEAVVLLRREELLLHRDPFVEIDPEKNSTVSIADLLRFRHELQLCRGHAVDLLRASISHVEGLHQILPAAAKAEHYVTLKVGAILAQIVFRQLVDLGLIHADFAVAEKYIFRLRFQCFET